MPTADARAVHSERGIPSTSTDSPRLWRAARVCPTGTKYVCAPSERSALSLSIFGPSAARCPFFPDTPLRLAPAGPARSTLARSLRARIRRAAARFFRSCRWSRMPRLRSCPSDHRRDTSASSSPVNVLVRYVVDSWWRSSESRSPSLPWSGRCAPLAGGRSGARGVLAVALAHGRLSARGLSPKNRRTRD